MIYGYARVSTAGQAAHGNSLPDQVAKLQEAGAETVIQESYTGTKMERPRFSELLDKLQPGDTLMVCKLDRFARTAADGAHTIQQLLKRGVSVRVLDMGLIDDTAMGRLMVTMLLAFAEFERSSIVQRNADGKARAKESAKKRGVPWREGRPPKYTEAQISHAVELLNENSFKQVEAMTGISKSTLIRARNRAKS